MWLRTQVEIALPPSENLAHAYITDNSKIFLRVLSENFFGLQTNFFQNHKTTLSED